MELGKLFADIIAEFVIHFFEETLKVEFVLASVVCFVVEEELNGEGDERTPDKDKCSIDDI